MRINVGPIHPSTHGVIRFVLDVDGDTVKGVETHIGFLHRGVEKLMETRTYMQNPSYTEKLDYAAPLCWDDAYVAAVEQAIGIEVKQAAQYARMVLLELQRIASHLFWIGIICTDLGQPFTIYSWAFRDRARVIRVLEDVAGTRMFYVNLRYGGLQRQLPSTFADSVNKLLDYLEHRMGEYRDVIDANSVFMERTKSIGILTRQDAIAHGVSGPVLRGSGVDEDVRKSAPYYAYDKVHFRVPIGTRGDSYDRYMVRYEEILQSISIARQALEALPQNADVVGMPIRLIGPNAKSDIVIARREVPKGEALIYLVPDKQRPYRISLRSPAFANLSALPKMANNQKFMDFFSILGSLDVVVGELDR